MAKIGRQTWEFTNQPRIISTHTSVGPKEGAGPLGDDFDHVHPDAYLGTDSWEKAERLLAEEATQKAIDKAGLQTSDIDIAIAGDLLNQIITASFSARSLSVPFLGIYNACATSMEGLAIASALTDGGYATYALAATSSHNSTAERQYRYPTEYGAQKPPTAQCTVTGAGAAIVTTQKDPKYRSLPIVTHATIGKVIDLGIKSPWEMGPAMAPAAADTIHTHFDDTGRTPDDYDLIITGDLARVGLPIARELLEKQGYNFGDKLQDSGIWIYNESQEEVFSGGSGAACSAVVAYGPLFKRMKKGEFSRILVVATGALLSPITTMQGESIPCIAHAVAIERGDVE